MMTEPNPSEGEVDQFLLDRIESVPHLEALLLLWSNKTKFWTVEEMTCRLYVELGVVKRIVDDLVREQLVVAEPGLPERYRYQSISEQQDRLIQAVLTTYQREVVRVSNLIHSKPPAGVREFARAFRFTKERK
jgi:DNA-binding MarR family transcriptional regulator